MIIVNLAGEVLYPDVLGLDENRAWSNFWEDTSINTSNAMIIDLPPPEGFVPGEFTYANGVLTASPAVVAQLLAKHKLSAVMKIDSEVDQIYAQAIGNRGPEYIDAEKAASDYIAAGYIGDVPPEVQSWATAKGWTATQAADDIITAAASLNGAKQAIRAARLLRKEQARNAVDEAALAAVMAQWSGFVSVIRGQLGL